MQCYAKNDYYADCIGLPITLQITARVTWSGWPCIARSHTEISLSLSERLHRGTDIAFRLDSAQTVQTDPNCTEKWDVWNPTAVSTVLRCTLSTTTEPDRPKAVRSAGSPCSATARLLFTHPNHPYYWYFTYHLHCFIGLKLTSMTHHSLPCNKGVVHILYRQDVIWLKCTESEPDWDNGCASVYLTHRVNGT